MTRLDLFLVVIGAAIFVALLALGPDSPNTAYRAILGL